MANSPEPSTSGTPDPQTPPGPASVAADASSASGKKRTRRKPRNRSKKDVPDNVQSFFDKFEDAALEGAPADPTEVELTFAIGRPSVPSATAFRKRNRFGRRINVASFAKNRGPCVFQTRGRYGVPRDVLRKIEDLSLNGVRKLSPVPPKNHVRPINDKVTTGKEQAKATSTKKKNKEPNKKKGDKFLAYYSKDEVARGLESGQLMKGHIRINPKNFKEAYVGNEDVTKSDHMIVSVVDRNRALDGDEVVLRFKDIKEGAEQRKTLEVVYITKMVHPRQGVGFLKRLKGNKEFADFSPRDRRIPNIRIPKICWPNSFQANPKPYENILFVAQITEWAENRHPTGIILENLGLNGDLKIESLAILREHCLDPAPYAAGVREFLPTTDDIPAEEFALREDIRKECVFTIDPATARDLDDAVSCKRLPNGNFEVGVHISDASHFLAEGTPLDEIVKSKATTIYMVDAVYHMLPVELCLHCSLLPGKDKLSFSAFWEMTPEGEVVDKRLTKTVMNSCVQLSYEHAQLMIEEPDRAFGEGELPPIHNGFAARDLSRVVNDLQRLAVKLREKRFRDGALRIDQVKISFSLDPATGEPLNYCIYENKDAHRLIEEFMLLANMTVAQWILHTFPDLAFLRLHEPPKPTMLDELQKNLETVGIHIDISSSGGINSSLTKYVSSDFLGLSRLAVLNHLFAKPMMRAKYFCAGASNECPSFNHYALSVPLYTHFTSPIRRYADIVVHRLLAASLGYSEKPKWHPEEVAAIAETCNRQKYNAKKAGEASSDLYLAHYVEKHQPFIKQAVVVDAKERSVDVIVLSTGSVVRLHTHNFDKGVTWKSEQIQYTTANKEDDLHCKKMWRIMVNFPPTKVDPPAFMVLEIFTIVTVDLKRKPGTNKLEAKLLRPLPSLTFFKT